MKDRMKKIVKIKISEKLFAFFAVTALIIGLIPLMRLSFYACPFYDDYAYGLYVMRAYKAGLGLKGMLEGLIYNVRTTWYAWQGTYGSGIVMNIMPAAFGEEYYFLGSWENIICLTLGIMVFVWYSLKVFVKASTANCISVASLVSLFLLELVVTAHQAYYWFDGAIHYSFMYGIMLLYFASCLAIIYTKSTVSLSLMILISMILAFFTAGANYVATLQGCLVSVLFLIIPVVKKSKRIYALIPANIVYAIGMYYNVMAPGNAHREAFYDRCTPIESVLLSFKAAFIWFPKFTGFITIAVILILVPVLWNIVINSEIKYRLPGVVSILSFCLYATGFTPSYYGMGFWGVERTMNDVKFTFQILLIMNVLYWLGWISGKLKERGRDIKPFGHLISYYAGCLVLVAVIFITSNNQAGSFASYGAYYYVHTGEAACYRQEYLNTLKIIEESDKGDVVVPAHVYRPWLLCEKDELSDDPEAEQNVFMAQYYGINSIRIETKEQQ